MAYARGAAPKPRICINAGDDPRHQARPAPTPGPRCATCNRQWLKSCRTRARNLRLGKSFGITATEYAMIKGIQGEMCICGPWTGYNGASRPLSVDHDHATGMIRGVLCKHCNDLIGRVKDDPLYFERMAAYLRNPPAVRALGPRYVPGG